LKFNIDSKNQNKIKYMSFYIQKSILEVTWLVIIKCMNNYNLNKSYYKIKCMNINYLNKWIYFKKVKSKIRTSDIKYVVQGRYHWVTLAKL